MLLGGFSEPRHNEPGCILLSRPTVGSEEIVAPCSDRELDDPGEAHAIRSCLAIKGKPFGFMYTENKYSNFRLHVEWKYPIEGSNSGIFLFLQEPTKELWPNAVECQLCSGRAGDFVLLGGSDVSEYKAPEGKPRPKFPVVERFVKERENPVGEWNSADIICKDGNIEVYINGALQNIGTKSAHSKGYIGLQSEGGDILFRNVRLTPID